MLAAALVATSVTGCKNGLSVPVWNPFAKPSGSSLSQNGENSYVQPNMPQSSATASSWKTPFKKIGDAIASPFKDSTDDSSSRIAENDPIALASKVGTPNANLYVSMAKLHERSGKWSDAVAEYDKALDVDPQDLQALLGLAHLYDRLARYEEALIFYGRAAQVDNDNAAIQNDLALCLARADKLKDAASALRRAVALDSKKILYRNNLATVLVELNRVDEAYQTLVSVHGEAVAHYNVGFLLQKRDRKTEALRHFEQALAIDPTLTEAKQWVASLGGKPAVLAEKSPSPGVIAPKPALAPVADESIAPWLGNVAPTTSPSTAPTKSAAASAPTPAPASSPLVEVNAAEIPRPSIAKSAPAPALQPEPAKSAAPASPEKTTAVSTEATPVAKLTDSPKNESAGDSGPGLLDGSSPRRRSGSQEPPLPEQISGFDVASAPVATTASAAKATRPRFPASRY
jgi:tetratricopeptide (TPR) repeat protein